MLGIQIHTILPQEIGPYPAYPALIGYITLTKDRFVCIKIFIFCLESYRSPVLIRELLFLLRKYRAMDNRWTLLPL